jgi:hypothetical protein
LRIMIEEVEKEKEEEVEKKIMMMTEELGNM